MGPKEKLKRQLKRELNEAHRRYERRLAEAREPDYSLDLDEPEDEEWTYDRRLKSN